MKTHITPASARLQGKHAFTGHYEVMGSVELSGPEAEQFERQIAEADAEIPAAQVSFAWILRTLRSGTNPSVAGH
jgi:hypothetical protein